MHVQAKNVRASNQRCIKLKMSCTQTRNHDAIEEDEKLSACIFFIDGFHASSFFNSFCVLSHHLNADAVMLGTRFFFFYRVVSLMTTDSMCVRALMFASSIFFFFLFICSFFFCIRRRRRHHHRHHRHLFSSFTSSCFAYVLPSILCYFGIVSIFLFAFTFLF